MSAQLINILLVEDDEIDRDALVRYVQQQNLPFKLRTATDKAGAVNALQQNRFDVVLLDYNLGNDLGFEILPFTRDTPVIFITGSGSEETAVEAMRLGAFDYLIKDIERKYLKVLPVTIQSAIERWAARQEVERLRLLLGDIINSMPSILVGVDVDCRVTMWNREAELIAGIPESEARGVLLAAVFPQLEGEAHKICNTIHESIPFRDELAIQSREGDSRLWDLIVYPLTAGKKGGAVIRIDDVTERMRIEAMMVHSEKMLSVGGLAAGMAHELNNPLAGILHNTQVMKNRLLGELPRNRKHAEESGISIAGLRRYMELRGIPEMMESIEDAGRRAAHIVDNLLTFSSSSDSRPRPQDLNRILDQALELAINQETLKNDYNFAAITIEKEYHTQLPTVLCEAGKIQQVFLNLLKNCAQALYEKKNLAVPRIILRTVPEDTGVRVEIEDNGVGMDKKVMKRIFEPFFTTRSVGKGAGLGLSVAYFIITRDHNGSMEAASVADEGTLMTIRLPFDRRHLA